MVRSLPEAVRPKRHGHYRIIKKCVLSVTKSDNKVCSGARRPLRGQMAAGQGFEPQLPGPEPGVLPLDDPATGAPSLAGQLFFPFGPLISSRYVGMSRFSASVSIRATTSTYGSSPEPCSFALSSPSTW
jgi:hypothetical protein